MTPTQTPPPPPARPVVNLSFSTDAILLVGALIWLLWDRLMKPSIAHKLDGVFQPIEEERRLTAILAQMGVLTGASRVILAAFHNGKIDGDGFHLQRLTTLNQYISPGCEPMPFPIRDLPIGRVMVEVESLMANPGWVTVVADESLPSACSDHLGRNDICRMVNRLVRIGNLPIGIVSIQYSCSERRCPDFLQPPFSSILEDLHREIGEIMRRRIVHPSKIKLLMARLLNRTST